MSFDWALSHCLRTTPSTAQAYRPGQVHIDKETLLAWRRGIYSFEVRDNDVLNGYKAAYSETFNYRKMSEEEIRNSISETSVSIDQSLSMSLQAMKDYEKDINSVLEDLLSKPSLTWQDRKNLELLIERQQEIYREYESMKENLREKEQLQSELFSSNPELDAKKKELQELFNKLFDESTMAKLEELQRLMEENKRLSADEIAVLIIKECGLMTALYEDRSVEGVSKQENVEELLKGITEFCELRREEAGDDSRISLSDFLAEVSLLTDQDNDKDEHSEKATLMTVHAAKGLEFKNVFIVGMEEDLFPSSMAKDSYRAIEEERRLFYVAITRAEKNCVLTYAKSRFRNGQSTICSPSRFLKDIDPEYLDLSDEIQAQWNRNTVLRSERTAFEDNHKPMFRSPLRQEPEKRVVRPLSRLEKAIHSPTAPNIEIPDIKPGMRIRHARFGEGVVIAMEGADGNVKATINFDNFGQKQLLLKFAKLQIIG